MSRMTYEHYDEEVYNAIDGSRNDLYQVAIGTLARSCPVPKVVYRLTSFIISFMPLPICQIRAHHWKIAVSRDPRK